MFFATEHKRVGGQVGERVRVFVLIRFDPHYIFTAFVAPTLKEFPAIIQGFLPTPQKNKAGQVGDLFDRNTR